MNKKKLIAILPLGFLLGTDIYYIILTLSTAGSPLIFGVLCFILYWLIRIIYKIGMS